MRVLALLTLLCVGRADGWTPPVVVLEPVQGSEWLSGASPEVRVVMKNEGSACRPLFITGTYFDAPAERPMTWLEFEITDARGKRLERDEARRVLRPRYTMSDLLLLHCGVSYSWRIALDLWDYRFEPGRYEVRARVRNQVAEFFERHPKERDQFMATFGLDPGFGGELLLDFETTSNKIEILVSP
jgi:hypothetical protein